MVLPSLPAVCKGERKTLLSSFTLERCIFWVFFLSQLVLIEREGEERRGGQEKYAYLSWADINPLPRLKTGCELGQLMGRHIFASATSTAGIPFLVKKKKKSPRRPKHRDKMSQAAAERSSRACQSVKAISRCFPLRGEICFLAARSHAFEICPVHAAFLSFVPRYCWL